MRFIRVHGRVVPIREESGQQPHSNKEKIAGGAVAAAGAYGATVKVVNGRASKSMSTKSMKYGLRAGKALGKVGGFAKKADNFGKAAEMFKKSPAADGPMRAASFTFRAMNASHRATQAKGIGLKLGKISQRFATTAKILARVKL